MHHNHNRHGRHSHNHNHKAQPKTVTVTKHEPIFPCASCMSPLATKRLPSGEVVKRWPDNLCPTCWAANDIVQNRGKYPDLTDRLVELLHWFDTDELVFLLRPDTNLTLYGDILGGLYYLTHTTSRLPQRDWEGEIEQLRGFIKSVKAFPLPVLTELHRRLVPVAA